MWTDIAEASQSSRERFAIHGKNFPTVKSQGLRQRIVEASSNPGDLVFIPFGGSGSEAIACELLGRKWILTEISQDYINDIIVPRFSTLHWAKLGYNGGVYKEPNSPYTMFLIRMTDIVRNRQLNEQEVEIERAIGELVQKNHSNGIEMVVLNGALSLMKPNQETVMAKKSDKATKRHLAAVKAWETRRTNEKKQKRHLAAVKAWETRRAKGV